MSRYTPGKLDYVRNGGGTFTIFTAESEKSPSIVVAEVYTGGIKNPEALVRLMAYSPELFEAVKLMNKGYRATRAFLKHMKFDTSAIDGIIENADELIDKIKWGD